MRLTPLGLATVVLLSARPAAAQNIVGNPSFEIGNLLSPWVNSTGYGAQPGQGSGTSFGTAHTGNWARIFTEPTCCGAIDQTLTTVAGQQYAVSFWGRSSIVGSQTNGFQLFFGDLLTPLISVTNVGTGWTLFQAMGTATGTSTVLRIGAYNSLGPIQNGARNELDDVSVVASAPSTVPEPATWALLGTGLLAVRGVARRRRRTPG